MESEMEMMAQMAIDETSEFIDIENQFIKAEHDLLSRLRGLEYTFMHLFESAEEDLGSLAAEASIIFNNLRDSLEADEKNELRFEKEEKSTLEKLKKDIAHRNWRAVKKDISEEEKEQKNAVRMQKKEIKHIHSQFMSILKLLKRAKSLDMNKEGIESYFKYIYKFANTYERIFRHLWKKEIVLKKKI